MKIVSLLPSATEIVCALGLEGDLVAVTHECDYPASVRSKPVITKSVLSPEMSSAEIDIAVCAELSADAHTLYTIDEEFLQAIAPDLIITQRLCDVCAVDYDIVVEAARSLSRPPQVVNLEPVFLEDVLGDIERVGAAAGRLAEARKVIAALEERIERVKEKVAQAKDRPRILLLEWIDPLYCGGHWNPQLVQLAGGYDGVGKLGKPSVRIEWRQVVDFAPDVMVVSCCGYSAERAREDESVLRAYPGYEDLPCVRSGRVHFVDGSAYYSRPGPRLVDSLEMMARFIHPELF
ncbi:MAG TPA: cobalamin-binding protein [Capsulimonadaceae bacterium]|nr:cobalamin-binding protein [Capsulimonadaceae bacterium]